MERQLGPVYMFKSKSPHVESGVFIAPTAAVIGDVSVGEGSSIWFSAVVRGDDMPVRIGRNTNIQDGAIIHSSEDVMATEIGDEVVVGHGAIIHGAIIGDRAMIGMGAVILDGAIVESGAVVAAGAIVPPGKRVPAGTLWLGNPGGVKRQVRDAERGFVDDATSHYRMRGAQYLADGIGYHRNAS